ncbi:putative helix turn helix protein [Chrysochromulina ericina virus CeV-01B]|uniref:Helix turn helix protein n=1 Tax=Chrysochromulina ericina virus CeV-01B TaxID=3070830 RepID=A0A0N9QR31_9VIRU|nr:putative helix turn helix protein [Chrysochromulina ericina virus]ALH23311.1 putative helix turn helix protein [Chrysochromulina ericina virus CeV-01B]
MDHQDWNTITLTTKSTNARTAENNKKISQKISSQDVKIEAPPNLGKLIEQARGGKTRQILANSLGVAVTLLTRWETGKDIPTNSDIAKIERQLGVKLPRTKKTKIEN